LFPSNSCGGYVARRQDLALPEGDSVRPGLSTDQIQEFLGRRPAHHGRHMTTVVRTARGCGCASATDHEGRTAIDGVDYNGMQRFFLRPFLSRPLSISRRVKRRKET